MLIVLKYTTNHNRIAFLFDMTLIVVITEGVAPYNFLRKTSNLNLLVWRV